MEFGNNMLNSLHNLSYVILAGFLPTSLTDHLAWSKFFKSDPRFKCPNAVINFVVAEINLETSSHAFSGELTISLPDRLLDILLMSGRLSDEFVTDPLSESDSLEAPKDMAGNLDIAKCPDVAASDCLDGLPPLPNDCILCDSNTVMLPLTTKMIFCCTLNTSWKI